MQKENKNLSFDEKLMQDIDLMILGQNPYKYNNYSKLIRLQYSNYPDSVVQSCQKTNFAIIFEERKYL